jgi:hypothetical protein
MAAEEKATTPAKTEEPQKPAAGVRRGPGVKEIPEMAWKLIGTSNGTPVVLLKCVDRADAEAQLKRLEAERYYQDLDIVAVNAKISLSASLIKARQRVIDDANKEKAAPKVKAAPKAPKKRGGSAKTPVAGVIMAAPKKPSADAASAKAKETGDTKTKKTKTAAKKTTKAATTRATKTKKTAKTTKKTVAKKPAKAKATAKKKTTKPATKKATAKKKTAKKKAAKKSK